MSDDDYQLENYWKVLGILEVDAIDYSFIHLKKLDVLAEMCMNLALKTPFLQGKNSGSSPLTIASLFLKRTMSDFRAAWLLMNWGYPYQAACVVASLYEHASIVNCVCDSAELAKKAVSGKDGDIPWRPIELAQMCAQKDLFGVIESKAPNNAEFESAWRHEYHSYKLLCKMKHPTMQQLKDEALMTLTDKNQFVVAAKPDVRNDSLGLKQLIMLIAIRKLFSAIKNIAQATNCEKNDKDEDDYKRKIFELYEGINLFIKDSEISKAVIKVYGYDFYGSNNHKK